MAGATRPRPGGAAVSPGERVLGWDLLRGLSAIAVAAYHLLLWQGLATVHPWGSYGVYLFFVLSGASLAYTYAPRLQAGSFSFRSFLWVRYVRLAPLYLALLLLVLPWKIHQEGWTAALAGELLLNASFLFGWYEPAARSMLVGGWSLGIEAVFYLLFPLFMAAALRPRWGLAAGVALLLVQALWIVATAGAESGYQANAVRYHHAPAFAGYFMGGCLLGLARLRGQQSRWPALPGASALVGVFAVMLALQPERQGDELLGWRGLLFAALCFGAVWLAGGLRMRRRSDRIATALGDATYGVYLLHPVLYFGLALVLLPRLGLPDPTAWPAAARAAFTMALLTGAFALAVLSERRLERPLREWSKRGRRRQSEAASISS